MRTRGNELLARVPRRSGGEGLFRVPGLEELVADPDRVRVLDAHTTCILKMRAIAALNLLNAHDMELLWSTRGTVPEGGAERLLRVKEAAKKFGVTADWLYRHHDEFSFTVRHGRLLRFSVLGMEQHIRKRRS
jgi:predicted DNA-binding transcriptional regulator AlpA